MNETITISTKDLTEYDTEESFNALRDIAALMMIDAAINSELCRIHKLNEDDKNNLQVAQMLENLNISIAFNDFTAVVNLSCEDTSCAFSDFIRTAIDNVNCHRTNVNS